MARPAALNSTQEAVSNFIKYQPSGYHARAPLTNQANKIATAINAATAKQTVSTTATRRKSAVSDWLVGKTIESVVFMEERNRR
ncbi:hypothetical protein GCM10007901_26770 [Dyella acidisoli]|uniref:Uncharacterized protein n=1 Tax=Dyella acidisoli TaxID=1867834 RepID=A0ABQ5XT95_9GAMM|nr:hypothetical protein GCM10007901_26770 [Dyella acidisoli]